MMPEDKQNDIEDDMLNLIQLVMSSTSTERLQLEVMRCLTKNPELLFKFLSRQSEKQRAKATKARRKSSEKRDDKVGNTSLEETGENFTLRKFAYDSERNGSLENGSNSDAKEKASEEKPPAEKDVSADEVDSGAKPVKRRKSKYCNIQGDLSHIRRDPKRSKAESNGIKETTKKRKTAKGKEKITKRSEDIGDVENRVENENPKGVHQSDERLREVHRMIDILVRPSSKEEQQGVLSRLRRDPVLRELFLKEKASLGKQRVPVFKAGNGEVTDTAANPPTIPLVYEEDSSNKEMSSDIAALLQILSKSGDPTKTPCESQPVFASLLQNHPNQHYSPTTSQSGSSDSACSGQHAIFSQFSPMLSVSSAHDHLSSQADDNASSADDQVLVDEISLQSDKTTFDLALHEHFQHLSRDQFDFNNQYNISLINCLSEKEKPDDLCEN